MKILNPLKDILPETVFNEPAVLGAKSSEKQLDRKNLKLASELLDQAGWEVGSDGLRKNSSGETLDIEILNSL